MLSIALEGAIVASLPSSMLLNSVNGGIESSVPVVERPYVHSYARARAFNKSYSISEYAFKSSAAVNNFVALLVEKEQFSLAAIKRASHRELRRRGSMISEAVAKKPSGLHVREMFDPLVFQSGQFSLFPESHPLRADRMAERHRAGCPLCRSSGSGIASSCYFSAMLRCITHGWRWPVDESYISPKYHTDGNYPAMDQFSGSTSKEFLDMVDTGVLIPFSMMPGRRAVRNPLGVVVKKSDIVRGLVLVNVVVKDQASMDEANKQLLLIGQPRIKARITTDFTASGVNWASYSPPFQYPSLQDGLRLISRRCFIGKTDVTRYFHSFAIAYESRHLCVVFYQGVYYVYARCPFGYTTCPYYASTWSAEFRQWLLELGIETAHLMDDWLVTADTETATREKLAVVREVIQDVGFVINAEKDEVGQVITFLGVHLDSVNMTLRFEGVQAKGMRLELESYLQKLTSDKQLDHSTIRHTCGKLNWYSEVVQSGRLHIRSWWHYERHRANLYPATFRRLLTDTQWWIDLLRSWESDTSAGIEYSILSASELLSNPEAVVILQSDASGTDGFGYYFSYLSASQLSWVSKRWPLGYLSVSSHTDELAALADFLECSCSAREAVLVWVTDSESAMWSVNKGRCFEPSGELVLTRVLHWCDVFHLQIVALWVPRELNELADHLSHLACSVDRDEVSGTWDYDDTHS